MIIENELVELEHGLSKSMKILVTHYSSNLYPKNKNFEEKYFCPKMSVIIGQIIPRLSSFEYSQ
jgi:hypothetical protein